MIHTHTHTLLVVQKDMEGKCTSYERGVSDVSSSSISETSPKKKPNLEFTLGRPQHWQLLLNDHQINYILLLLLFLIVWQLALYILILLYIYIYMTNLKKMISIFWWWWRESGAHWGPERKIKYRGKGKGKGKETRRQERHKARDHYIYVLAFLYNISDSI